MCTLNIFTQMTLHYNPELQFSLFSHLETFCNLARKFKFEHCYMYENGQRTQIASQTTIPFVSRTASWATLNDELFNAFLRDSSS